MPQQSAVTLRAPIRPERLTDLTELLAEMHRGGIRDGRPPLPELPGVHFARLLVLPATTGPLATRPSLLYMADVDGPASGHLDDLARSEPGLDSVFGHCVDYPPGSASRSDRRAWLEAHQIGGATTYVHAAGRTVEQVRDEARLRSALEDFLDQPGVIPEGAPATEVHRRLRAFVRSSPDLRWALRRPAGPGLLARIRQAGNLVAPPAVAVLLAPVLLPAAVLLVLAVRRQEGRDVPMTGPVPPEHARELEQYEDLAAQNAFTAVGVVKPGLVRQLTLRSVLAVLGYGMRHFYQRDNLGGVRTIHFARWLPIDDGRRLIFASSYDGSLESYMDDFIDRLAAGLNVVFSNGEGYPRTRWLVQDGSRDEGAFKQFLRRHQLPTQVWYAAYGEQTARNVDAAAQLRRGLATSALTEPAAQAWLSYR